MGLLSFCRSQVKSDHYWSLPQVSCHHCPGCFVGKIVGGGICGWMDVQASLSVTWRLSSYTKVTRMFGEGSMEESASFLYIQWAVGMLFSPCSMPPGSSLLPHPCKSIPFLALREQTNTWKWKQNGIKDKQIRIGHTHREWKHKNYIEMFTHTFTHI